MTDAKRYCSSFRRRKTGEGWIFWVRRHGALWSFRGAIMVCCGRLNVEGCRSYSPQAALGLNPLLNCSELEITHTPTLAKIFYFFLEFAWWGHAGAGVTQVSGSGFVGSGWGESEAGHIGVYALILAGGDLVGFVPDADGSIASDVLIEGFPCGEVGCIARLGVVDEVVEGAPVLGDHDAGHVEGGESAEKA